jgi:hypothetical protein
MPAITTNQSILKSARNAIEILLKFKGISVVVMRKGVAIDKPGGGHDFTTPHPLAMQVFSLTQTGADIMEDGTNGDTPVVRRNYLLTGRYDADLRVDDTWEDGEAEYRVETCSATSGYKTTAEVVGFVKVS